jgi:hypothetical protein
VPLAAAASVGFSGSLTMSTNKQGAAQSSKTSVLQRDKSLPGSLASTRASLCNHKIHSFIHHAHLQRMSEHATHNGGGFSGHW